MTDDIFGVLLAAGKSSRMGKNKLNLPFREDTVGSHALDAAIHSDLDHVLVMTKPDDSLEWIDDRFFSGREQIRWSRITTDQAEKGQAFTIRAGIQACRKYGARAAMILLGDQPLVSVDILNRLIRSYREKNMPIVAACYQDRPQPPILFDASQYQVLTDLQGDQGARAILRGKDNSQMKMIACQERAWFHDIDTEGDYAWLMRTQI
ncbi:nucleotidyltransferase family protein [Paraliobacillus sediminis]|uniref:nucleotidyltransferase family protein n=1 Tax=Paraliobacillus sediminis TaxID=1885916 RepID=UPI000E3E3EC4|nr:NTP transferase domain-containing protein [Paraliobacillus sediminis]